MVVRAESHPGHTVKGQVLSPLHQACSKIQSQKSSTTQNKSFSDGLLRSNYCIE